MRVGQIHASPRLDTSQNSCVGCKTRRNVGSAAVLRGKAQRECHQRAGPSKNLRRHGIDCPELGVTAGLIAAASRRHAIKGAALVFCAAATEKTDVYSYLRKLSSQIVTILLDSMAVMVQCLLWRHFRTNTGTQVLYRIVASRAAMLGRGPLKVQQVFGVSRTPIFASTRARYETRTVRRK